MKHQVLYLALCVTLLVAGCHRKQRQLQADTVAEPTTATDSKSKPNRDTITSALQPNGTQLHTDTAETTNLRLFARKQRTIYSPALLTGEWQRGNEHEQYAADGTGQRWVTADDVSRDEAQHFSWTMDSNLLTFKYRMALGGLMVRQYVVTFADDETLVYGDAYGASYMWDRVPDSLTDRPANHSGTIGR